MLDHNHVFHHPHALAMADETVVVVESRDLVVVVAPYYNDYYVVVDHMVVDWMKMVVEELDDHMDVEVKEVFDQYYYVEMVEVVVVMIDLEVEVTVVQDVFVVMDTENVDYNCY